MDYLTTRLLFLIFALIVRDAYKCWQMDVVCVLFALYAIDFVLSFNDPYLKITLTGGYFIPCSYPLIMGLTLTYIYVRTK